MQEVTGSIPVFSTRSRPQRKLRSFYLYRLFGSIARADMESTPTGMQPGCAGSGPMAGIGTLQSYSKERLRENPANIFSFFLFLQKQA